MVPPSEESPFRLLVEGTDDCHSVINLMKQLDFDWDDTTKRRPFIQRSGGIDKLLPAVSVTLKGTYERIGIIVDANSDPGARWLKLQHRAHQARSSCHPHQTPTERSSLVVVRGYGSASG